MPGRTNSSESYRYGFNGKEKVDEISGSGNNLDFGARIYNPRLGKWMSVDPQFKVQPGWSSYKSFLNNPIVYKDTEGEIEYLTIILNNERTGKTTTFQKVVGDEVFTSPYSVHNVPTDKYGNYYQARSWYDKNTTLNITMDKGGNYTVNSLESSLVGDAKTTTAGPLINSSWWANFKMGDGSEGEGNGGTQRGGWNLVSKDPGASPTKYKAANRPEIIEVSEILAAFAAGGKAPKMPKGVTIPDVILNEAEAAKAIVPEWVTPNKDKYIDAFNSQTTGSTTGSQNGHEEVKYKDVVTYEVNENGDTTSMTISPTPIENK